MGINCSNEDGLTWKSFCLNKCFIQFFHLISLQPLSHIPSDLVQANSDYTAYGNYKNYVTCATDRLV